MQELRETQQIIITPLEKSINSLENGTFSKLICGASNTNEKHIERLSLVYALAGVDIIDISPKTSSFNAAKQGIEKAKELNNSNSHIYKNFNEPLIMISLNAGKDEHFRKAKLNKDKCIKCTKCLDICQSKAIKADNKSIILNYDTCYGCGRCLTACNIGAITLSPVEFTENNQLAKAVEIHTGSCSVSEIKNFVKNNKTVQSANLLSFSIESNLFSPIEIKKYIKEIIQFTAKKIIIQIDGSPMSATNDEFSGIQSITYANILSDFNKQAYIQVAGGTNHLTKKYIDLFNLKIAGIGYGTFARKIILSYIEELSDREFIEHLKKCVNIATNLVLNM